MMRIAITALVLAALTTLPVAAQSPRIYVAGEFAGNSGSRGPVDVGTFPTIGGLLGLRVAEAWSIEFEVDRGFAESSPRIIEGLLSSQVTGPGPHPREELERRGVFGRSVHSTSVGSGSSAHVVWTSRAPGPVNVAVLGGLSWRVFHRRHTLTITGVGRDVTYPPDHPNLRDIDQSRPLWAAGLTGGLMVPVRLTRGLSIAPEIRLTLGLATDESRYQVMHTGLRLMWGF